MAVQETGFRWICDWCGLHKTTAAGDRSIPEDWLPVEGGAFYEFEMEHLCSAACWQAARHADILAHELDKHVVRMVRRHWKAADITDVPDPGHVDLAFVIDGKTVEVE